MCGKNASCIAFAFVWLGSPPRVREKRQAPCFGLVRFGITPACAGKTLVDVPDSEIVWDHPRVCGKNCIVQVAQVIGQGSPPRVREKQKPCKLELVLHGITPACAGKTTVSMS